MNFPKKSIGMIKQYLRIGLQWCRDTKNALITFYVRLNIENIEKHSSQNYINNYHALSIKELINIKKGTGFNNWQKTYKKYHLNLSQHNLKQLSLNNSLVHFKCVLSLSIFSEV